MNNFVFYSNVYFCLYFYDYILLVLILTTFPETSRKILRDNDYEFISRKNLTSLFL